MNYLTQIVETIRVPNVNDVEALHTELKNDNRFELKKFEYQHKEIKQKGEVIEEYELVKATLCFNFDIDSITINGKDSVLYEKTFVKINS